MMQHNDTRPSYLIVDILVEESELRELLGDVCLYALQPGTEVARI